ncbi:MAG TPA: polysaccharide deacetylase family protein [Terriglobales bacterium]|nr:polysaccharide deacetylase family protein [Terriglobales bacterium]
MMPSNNKHQACHPGSIAEFTKKVNADLVTRQARIYALWELSRRAGIRREQFDRWTIDTGPQSTVIWIDGVSPKKVSFPLASAAFWKKVSSRQVEVVRASWMFSSAEGWVEAIPDFVVPFSTCPAHGMPLFQAINLTHVSCSVDLLTSILLTLSRYEEAVSEKRDNHGRFSAVGSLAAEHRFLDRPIIDEYGLAFQQALTYLMPGWAPPARELRVKLSHDIDQVGMPFRLRPVLGHTLARRNPGATLRDITSVLGAAEPSYLKCVRTICKLSMERGLDSALYWKSPPASDNDTGYSLHESRTQNVIHWARGQGIEMGAHPGYYTYGSPEKLKAEFDYIRCAVGESLIGGRQHYLRWSPTTWEHWEACGVGYDSTVGYADQIGFRAGTCIPYKPWLLGPGREAHLLEIPLIVMDATVATYMSIPEEKQLDRITPLIDKCRLVGGVFTLLWHNASLLEPGYGNTYIQLLDLLAGAKRFAWEDELRRGNADLSRISCA